MRLPVLPGREVRIQLARRELVGREARRRRLVGLCLGGSIAEPEHCADDHDVDRGPGDVAPDLLSAFGHVPSSSWFGIDILYHIIALCQYSLRFLLFCGRVEAYV